MDKKEKFSGHHTVAWKRSAQHFVFYVQEHHLFVFRVHRCAAGGSMLVLLRPFPAIGLSLSSHSVTPSQAQICLGFWKRPADLAMMPHAILQKKKKKVIVK